ncbi:c-type cytochrome [Ramlibacter alkalitolerans]|uniref:Cytochrome c4 n=1 Tax=Ramlibacter alkalitolerans TaxID=2039631 RepID=A0ABS1JSY1_9BURK|nr:c-type cytochrome [Ramlibacter alkalitolerans]MBL0427281.1 cytochrome c4 [Ramlibacter alkalitolerans]
MKNLLTTVFALSVACVTSLAASMAEAQTPNAGASGNPGVPAVPGATGPGPAKAVASPKSLEAKTAMCFGCHNIKGYQSSFPEVYKVPMIAGQNAKYIASALNAYKTGDRKHPTMRGIAETLSEQDIADIAAFYENLGKDERQAAPEKQHEPDSQVAGLIQKANCASCHGANFSKPIDPSYPKIAGQHSDYLFQALRAYKTENNPAVGRNNGIMGAIAKQFSNAELKAISQYLGSLDGEVATIPEPRFHHR